MTCEEDGHKQRSCYVCGLVESVTIPKQHAYEFWQVVSAPSDSAVGVKMRSCAKCGKEQYEFSYSANTLYEGVTGKDAQIAQLQRMLVDMGYLAEGNGRYGLNTVRAMQAFETAYGLEADGVALPGEVQLLTSEWQKKMGSAAQIAPAAVPTVPSAAQTAAVPCCSCQLNIATGVFETMYCEKHLAIANMTNTLLSTATSASARANALAQSEFLWQSEVDFLFDTWQKLMPAEGRSRVLTTRSTFDAFIATQKVKLEKQYPSAPDMMLEGVNMLLIEKCTELCGVVHTLSN